LWKNIISFPLSKTIKRAFAFSIEIEGNVVEEYTIEDPKALLNDKTSSRLPNSACS